MESLHLLQSAYERKANLFDHSYTDTYKENASTTALPLAPDLAWSRATPRFRLWNQFCRIFHSPSPPWSSCSLWKRKCVWRTLVKVALCSTLIFVLSSLYHSILNPSYSNPPEQYQILKQRVAASTTSGRGNVHNEKVFIAANILNEDLIRGHWGESLLSLVNLLGDENVFVSIYENDSGSGTRDALLNLQQQFSCNSSVVTGAHLPLSAFPTVHLPDGQDRVPRLTYLAEIRNRLLRPLDPSYAESADAGFQSVHGVRFDKILFLNDVYFSPLDAVQLLFSTNAESGKAQYRAACALDFVQLFKVYDSFVVRDADGYQLSLQYYPWFTHIGSGTSRTDVLEQTDAVRVRSCWGGMAAFDASVFQPNVHGSILPGNQSSTDLSMTVPTTGLPDLPIQFRDSGEPFWEAAECCLIFADMEYNFGSPSFAQSTGVFINPYIRTAYSATTWRWLPFFTRYERATEYFQRLAGMLKYPEHNPRRLHKPGEMVDETVWINKMVESTPEPKSGLRSRIQVASESAAQDIAGHFSLVRRKAQPGGYCGERRLFVMKQDLEAANRGGSGKNWEKIPVPWKMSIPPQ